MKLIRKDQAIHVDKTNGTKVDYYLLNDAEIHYNKIKKRNRSVRTNLKIALIISG